MHTEVRGLRHADTDEVARLEREARTATETQRGGLAHLAETPAVGEWSTIVDDPTHPVWVATIDGVPVGYLELTIDDAAARVRQVWVHPEARELGFGDDMLAAALARAREAGCAVLEGTALPGDRDTKNLYERAGITARKLIVSTRL
jgi:GNAT superfamily N-acetyltransferase